MRRLAGRPSPAMVVSIIALVMATAGSATAARALITNSTQIKKGVVNSGDIKDNAVSHKDIRDGSVKLSDLEASARTAIAGAGETVTEAVRKQGPADVPRNDSRRVATLKGLAAGSYLILAKTILSPGPDPDGGGLFGEGGNGGAGRCILRAGEDRDEVRNMIASPGYTAPTEFNAQITVTFAQATDVGLDCDSGDRTWSASDTSIVAIPAAQAERRAVDG